MSDTEEFLSKLKRLSKESADLDIRLKETLNLLENSSNVIVEMEEVTNKVARVFKLYKELTNIKSFE